jgi:uncharacterized membrane protein HdeD (DUF308 family)
MQENNSERNEKANSSISENKMANKQKLSIYLLLFASFLFLIAGILFLCIKTSSYAWLYLTTGILLLVASGIWLVIALYSLVKSQENKDESKGNKENKQ